MYLILLFNTTRMIAYFGFYFIGKVFEDHERTYKHTFGATSDNHTESSLLIDRLTTSFDYVYIENPSGMPYTTQCHIQYV